jgi:cell division protease FtsH
MSELGPMSFGKKEEQIFLGREIAQHRDYSESTAVEIDRQVRKLIESSYERARQVVTEKSDALVRIAEALLEREVLDASEVLDLIAGKTLPKLATQKPPSSDGGVAQPAVAPPQARPGLIGGESPQPA